jgi:hypothetical protein
LHYQDIFSPSLPLDHLYGPYKLYLDSWIPSELTESQNYPLNLDWNDEKFLIFFQQWHVNKNNNMPEYHNFSEWKG